MKRIIALLVSIVFLLNTTLAFTVTVIIDGVGLQVTCDTGESVEVVPVLNDIQRWEVKSGGVTITNNEFVMLEQDVVIEGVMSNYTISYNANGGSGAPTGQNKTYNVNLTLSSTVPTRNGYTFLGWSTNKNATTAEYTAGGTYTANVSVVLYAVWEEMEKYTISYEANAGEDIVANMPESQIKIHGIDLPLSSNLPTREGYNFNGWNTASNGNGTSYNAGETYTIDADMTLYAKWAINAYNVTGTASPEAGGTIEGTGSKTPGELVTLTATANTGYNFSKWEVVSGSITLSSTTNKTATFTMPENDVEVRAIFTGKTYTVSISNNISIIQNLNNKSTTTSDYMQYSISNGVVTVKALQSDGYGSLEAYVNLTSGTEYEFSCDINGIWGYEQQVYLLLNNQIQTLVGPIEKSPYTFTPTTSGKYYIRLDVNRANYTRTFSNLRVGPKSTSKNGVCGNTVSITAPTQSGYTFYGWEVVSGEVTLSSTSSRTTTFTMPASNVEIRAKYR